VDIKKVIENDGRKRKKGKHLVWRSNPSPVVEVAIEKREETCWKARVARPGSDERRH
jgi:hypothetical protein